MQNIIISKIMQFYSSNHKIFFTLLASFSLSSCAMVGKATDKVTDPLGFKFKNPFFSDNNAANKKYKEEYGYLYSTRKTPAGNLELNALSSKDSKDKKFDYTDSEKYSDQKMQDFWKKSYGDDYPKLKDVPTAKKTFIEIKKTEELNKPTSSIEAIKTKPEDKPLTIERADKIAPISTFEKAPVIEQEMVTNGDESVLEQIEFVDPTKYKK